MRAPPGDGHGVFSGAGGMILVVEDAVLTGELLDGLLGALCSAQARAKQKETFVSVFVESMDLTHNTKVLQDCVKILSNTN